MVGIQNLAMGGFQHYLLQRYDSKDDFERDLWLTKRSLLDTPYDRLEHAACDPAHAWNPPTPATESSETPDLPALVTC